MFIETKDGAFELGNENKYNIAVFGDGNNFEGLGADAAPEDILAEYDRRGGLIKLDGEKVANGSFYDFRTKKPRAKAVITFHQGPVLRPGTLIETTDGPGKGKGGKVGAKAPAKPAAPAKAAKGGKPAKAVKPVPPADDEDSEEEE